MCDFCDALIDENKKVMWYMRSTYSDDNLCEYVNDNNCSLCIDCISYFKINSHILDGNCRVSIEYFQKVYDEDNYCIKIRPFTEVMQWNYCPSCGKQLSNDIKPLNQGYPIKITEIQKDDQ